MISSGHSATSGGQFSVVVEAEAPGAVQGHPLGPLELRAGIAVGGTSLQLFFSCETRSEKLCPARPPQVSDEALNPICCAGTLARMGNHHDPHDHHAHGPDHSELDEIELRVRALETILTEKGYIDPAALDVIIETYETKVGPRNGARVVAKAWSDPGLPRLAAEDATAAIASLGYSGRQGEHMVAVENTPDDAQHGRLHAVLAAIPGRCSGLPPVWYKSAPYRSRAVKDPRGVLAEFGVTLPPMTAIRVWDSTAEVRYLVIPQRPDGTEGWSEEALAELVTRDSMIGTGLARRPEAAP